MAAALSGVCPVAASALLAEPPEEIAVIPAAETQPEPAEVAPPVPLTDEPLPPPVSGPLMNPPIHLPANHSFTLWTTPAALTAISKPPVSSAPVRSGLRLPGQPFTLWTQPGRVDHIVMRNGAAPAAGKTSAAPRDTVSTGQRWLPLAAGIAIAALFGMGYLSQKSQRQEAEENLTLLERKAAAEISTAQVQAKTCHSCKISAEDEK